MSSTNFPSVRLSRTRWVRPALALLALGNLAWLAAALAQEGFAGRSGRASQLEKAGGNARSEAAVARGLKWLALHQAEDGHWSLHDFPRHARDKPLPDGKVVRCSCQPLTKQHNDIAGTAFGLLPFLGAGITHKPPAQKQGVDYSKIVDAGLEYLLGKQDAQGFYGGDMYSQALATLTVCEAYGMTSDPGLKRSAQRGLDYIVSAQDPQGGGWRYLPRQPGDTSVTGWQLTALKSGQMAGLAVPRATLQKASRFLDSVETHNKGRFSYVPGEKETPSMTAVGLLCRMYGGISPRNAPLQGGVKYLKDHGPAGDSKDMYYLYYATQVMHHMGGDAWDFWNVGPAKDGKRGLRDSLIQRQDGGNTAGHDHQAGSWSGPEQGGRLMTTSLSLLCLEVYYRHLPLYKRDGGAAKDE